MQVLNYSFIFFISLIAYQSALADLPLTVEDLTADKNKFKLTSDLSYFNQSQRNLTEQGNSLVDLGNGRTLVLPNPPSEGLSNSDSLIGTLGLSYGVTDKWEIGAKTNAVYRQVRQTSALENNKTSDTRLQDFIFTTQYQLTDKHEKLPDSLIFSEISFYDNTYDLKPKSLSSVLIGGTVYTVNDPIILSLTSSYQYNTKRGILNPNQTINIGDVLSINGTVGFAVNPDITLNAGVGWQYKQTDKLQNKALGINQTQTNLNLGMAYSLSARNNLVANIRTNISGDEGSVFSLGLTTKLGELPPPPSERYRKSKAMQ
ncbi:hypothetical protein MOMA_04495 [Moraxella macacae 0408225]|uniref:Transporter n=2 Tax=Pseudomonadota TaxID=1224 RepID=L2F9S3_9GAMM|nr:transporter [Moraxella macacae]ELA09635.1 hypothetical protein MOMA_04495 [Moraxella macacae 0408225]